MSLASENIPSPQEVQAVARGSEYITQPSLKLPEVPFTHLAMLALPLGRK
jgi:hypothetical protein